MRRAIEDPEPRIMVDTADRAVMSRIAAPLLLGEQHDQYFVLGHHWPHHLGRALAKAGAAGRPVTVGDLRAWLDTPVPMGLPPELADLVVRVFAEQTSRTILVRGTPVDPAATGSLPADAVVVDQELPDETTWREALARGAAVFGISGVPDMRTARTTAALARKVRDAAAGAEPRLRRLVDALATRGPLVLPSGEDPLATDRARLAVHAQALVQDLRAATGDVAVLRALAGFDLGEYAAQHLGRTVASAEDVIAAVTRTDWNIFGTVTGWPDDHPFAAAAAKVRDDLARVWRANEIAEHLQPALGAADSEARQLVVTVTVVSGAQTVSSRSDVDALVGRLADVVAQGRRLEVTWREAS
ncbi:MAG TPA: hypothetical protein VKP64_09445 [Mycobacteriales bacterium]|nr:hypothetical protein [Mycobacteriales bacterium]